MAEVNLMARYPRSKRPIAQRGRVVTDADRQLSRQFGRDYFDGDRMHGYGGYQYHPRFWTDTVALMPTTHPFWTWVAPRGSCCATFNN